jgi:hypothetical protein
MGLVPMTLRQLQEVGREEQVPTGNAALVLERVIPMNAAHWLDTGMFLTETGVRVLAQN